MGLFGRLSTRSLAAKWTLLERIEVLDAALGPPTGEAMRRATLLGKSGLDVVTLEEFGRACVERTRAHSISALRAASIEPGSLSGADDPLAVTAACTEATRGHSAGSQGCNGEAD